MSKQVYLFVFLVNLFLTSYGQNTKIGDNIIIDSTIEKEVLNHISPFSNKPNDTLGLIYNSHILWDSYEEDSLINSTFTKDSLTNGPFKALYIFKEDSLMIIGEFGLISGFRFGFLSKIKNETLSTTHFFCDEFPAFKHKMTDSLDYCIEVGCPVKSIVLSRLPENDNREPLYGYINFLTNHFYEKGGDGIRRTKSRMKIYFKARFTEVKAKNEK